MRKKVAVVAPRLHNSKYPFSKHERKDSQKRLTVFFEGNIHTD